MKKLTHDDLIKVADETFNIIEGGIYSLDKKQINIQDDFDYCINHGKYYPTVKHNNNPEISVTDETTSAAAFRLIQAGHGDVAVLNFASARNPGGGWLDGAKAQEEDLARASNLGDALTYFQDYYKDNENAKSSLYTDGIIYLPKVPFFRDEELNLVKPYYVSVITCPAPNVSQLKSVEKHAVQFVLNNRAKRILEIASLNQHKTIVLGAWGCGVFGNHAENVIKAFQFALKEHSTFDRIVFAVYDSRDGQPVLNAFKKAFE